MQFNQEKSKVMLLDINSCFATIEQQANPNLRGLPIAVAAYTTDKGTILAASVDAKKIGIKTGMLVGEARKIYPKLVVLSPDPSKYRFVHNKLYKLLLNYSPIVEPKSIDEFILFPVNSDLWSVASEIKEKIKTQIGDYITVSIGIAPNRYLAKIGAGLIKPDGLVEINKDNYKKVYKGLELKSLTGVKDGIAGRLNSVGIYSVMDFYNASLEKLKIGLKKAVAYSWYLRLRGYEIDAIASKRKSFGNEVSLKITRETDIKAVVSRLFDKADFRARSSGFKAKKREFFVSKHKISVRLTNLSDRSNLQLDLFGQEVKKNNVEEATDKINKKWGDFVVGIARGFTAQNLVKDRISFHHLS